MEEAIASILVSPHFLFRIESESPKEPHRRAFELASRISFFLWGSVPDDLLLDAAENSSLLDRNTQRQHIDRMLKDEKTQVLMQHFVGNGSNFKISTHGLPIYESILISTTI